MCVCAFWPWLFVLHNLPRYNLSFWLPHKQANLKIWETHQTHWRLAKMLAKIEFPFDFVCSCLARGCMSIHMYVWECAIKCILNWVSPPNYTSTHTHSAGSEIERQIDRAPSNHSDNAFSTLKVELQSIPYHPYHPYHP